MEKYTPKPELVKKKIAQYITINPKHDSKPLEKNYKVPKCVINDQ
jgi:hypothetical protein